VKACVFVGPTLRPGDLPAIDNLAVLPPVAQGDLYRAALQRPRAIGIIDGYFDGVLSVWHKEILWAMAEGIHVLGSASMGALRAAELHDFGMQGVGRIFEAYHTGTLHPYEGLFEDDDEVAVIHGPVETGFLPLSEAMVNIRITLAEAARAGIIKRTTRDTLAALAKDLFYHDRSYDRLLARATEAGLPASEIAALATWLPQGRIDQKRADGLAMLDAMAALVAADEPREQVGYAFEWTEMWDEATLAVAGTSSRHGAVHQLPPHRILEELRLDPAAYPVVRDRTLLRLLARREAERRRQPIGIAAQRTELDRLRARHRLPGRADLDRWLDANELGADRLEQLITDEAHVQGLTRQAAGSLEHHLLDDLRLYGAYARLAERARRKQELLAGQGLDHPRPEDVGIPPAALLAWYFEDRLQRPIPDDIAHTAHELGFEDPQHFTRALLREWLYCREIGSLQQ